MNHVVRVHPHGARTDGVRDAQRRVEVRSVHSGRETVVGAVALLDRLLLGLELGDGADGTEDLLLDDLHVLSDVREDGGLDEVADVAVAAATGGDGGAGLLALVDVAHDAIELELRDLGSLEGLWVEWVTDLVCLCARLEAGDELVVDALLDVDAGAGAAALAVVEEDAEVDPGDGVLDVGVVEDDVGGLAAQLEGDLLEVGVGGGLEDLATDEGGAGEGDLVDVHVRGEGGAGGLAEAGDDVDDSGREAGLLDQLGGEQGGERGLLGGLEDDGVTGGDGWADLPRPHENWEVPWDDLSADTDLAGVSMLVRGKELLGLLTASWRVYVKVSGLVSMVLPSILSAQPP